MTTQVSKHTPGPWRVYKSSILSAANYKRMAEGNWNVQALAYTVGNDDATYDGGEVYANARLIAAAPALLEALQSMVWYAEPHLLSPVAREALATARAAIAQALGEEND